jgi:hypothetical protein
MTIISEQFMVVSSQLSVQSRDSLWIENRESSTKYCELLTLN